MLGEQSCAPSCARVASSAHSARSTVEPFVSPTTVRSCPGATCGNTRFHFSCTRDWPQIASSRGACPPARFLRFAAVAKGQPRYQSSVPVGSVLVTYDWRSGAASSRKKLQVHRLMLFTKPARRGTRVCAHRRPKRIPLSLRKNRIFRWKNPENLTNWGRTCGRRLMRCVIGPGGSLRESPLQKSC